MKTFKLDEALYRICESVNAGILPSGEYHGDHGWYRVYTDGSYYYLGSAPYYRPTLKF